ncbi:hypothetical protein, partial [Hymenobacter qilianensis]
TTSWALLLAFIETGILSPPFWHERTATACITAKKNVQPRNQLFLIKPANHFFYFSTFPFLLQGEGNETSKM